MSRKKHFYSVVYSEDSQFDYEDGELSCTFCCLEATKLLFDKERIYESPRKEIIRYIDKVTMLGVKNNPVDRVTSCDDAFDLHEKYYSELMMGDCVSGKLCDENSFLQLLKHIEKSSKPVACVLTKPIETILVFFNPSSPYRFIVYDSHGRLFGKKLYGAAFYFFLDRESCRKHLREIFKITYRSKTKKKKKSELLRHYNLFEGTLVHRNKEGKKKTNEDRNVIILNSVTPKKEPEKKKKTDKKKKTPPPAPQRIEVPHVPKIRRPLAENSTYHPFAIPSVIRRPTRTTIFNPHNSNRRGFFFRDFLW